MPHCSEQYGQCVATAARADDEAAVEIETGKDTPSDAAHDAAAAWVAVVLVWERGS